MTAGTACPPNPLRTQEHSVNVIVDVLNQYQTLLSANHVPLVWLPCPEPWPPDQEAPTATSPDATPT